MRWLMLVPWLAGCYEPEPIEPCVLACTPESGCPDGLACVANVCGPPGVCPEPICVGDDIGLVKQTCFVSVRPPQVFATDFPIDTGNHMTCDKPVPDNPDFCFLAAESIAINGVVTVRGPRPLVLWSTSSITIEIAGRIDAASHLLDPLTGPGANHSTCPLLLGGTAFGTTIDTGGGGCGGAFGTNGGTGGAGSPEDNTTVESSCDPRLVPLDALRGGCPGGNGGHATNRGSSGGAIYLMAAEEIAVHGRINASGAGAAITPATTTSFPGGGGGGSGGLIAFDAPVLDFDGAVLLAVGGGGGSGGGDAAGPKDGKPGNECPSESAGPSFVVSGSSQTVNINFGGGNTAAGGVDGGSVDSVQTGGGGGGGGGHGYIVVFPPQVVPMPAFTAVPAIPAPPT